MSDPSRGAGADGLLKQQLLVQRIVDAMVAQAPDGWTRIEAVFISAGRWLQLRLDVDTAEGPYPGIPEIEAPEEVRELRAAMYKPGLGTWFTMYLTIRSNGEVNTNFDYDNRPPRAGSFGRALPDDLEMYPRNSVSQWILDDIAETRRILAERGEQLDSDAATAPATPTAAQPLPVERVESTPGAESPVPRHVDDAIIAAAAGFVPENPDMTYRKITHSNGTAADPVQIFQEIDEEGYENRRVEVFRDGHADFASLTEEGETTSLDDDPVPPLDEVAERDGLTAEEITPVEFQTAWLAADGYS